MLAIRLTDRVGKGIRTAPRDAMIADTVSVEQRGLAFGFHRAMDHAGAVIGPLIGYVLVVIFVANATSPTASEFSKIFLVASVPALLAVLVAIFFMRESPVHVDAESKIQTLVAWLRQQLQTVSFDARALHAFKFVRQFSDPAGDGFGRVQSR